MNAISHRTPSPSTRSSSTSQPSRSGGRPYRNSTSGNSGSPRLNSISQRTPFAELRDGGGEPEEEGQNYDPVYDR